jgi:SAM-dependent methyltransferase
MGLKQGLAVHKSKKILSFVSETLMPAPDLVAIASLYWQSAALNAAVKLGVFPALAASPADASTLARTLNCSVPHLESLLDALCGLALLLKEAQTYILPPELRPLLDPASEDCLLEALCFNGDLFALWLQLPECIRSGSPVLPGNPHLGSDPERMKRFVRGMHSRAAIMARGLLPHIRPEANARLLDVGGGPGTFSLKLAERDPSLRITVLDLPPVVAAAAEIHAGKAAMSSITFQGGDYHNAPFPPDQDLVFYSGALHQEPEEVLPALLSRMKAALRPGGRLLVVDLMLDADRCSPSYSALFQLNMMLMRPSSRVYSVPRLEFFLEQAGFIAIHTRAIPTTPYSLTEALTP